ncbi:MAG TPA: major capsid protein [Bryobacteraceae bacterium]|jgi:hypothetical protein
MNPTVNAVHYDAPLSFVSNMYAQGQDAFIATRVFPMVSVPQASDLIYTINKGDFARNTMQKRAPGTESAGIGYNVDTNKSYRCAVWSIHNDIPDQIRANADAALNLEMNTTELLTKAALINREVTFASSFLSSGKWATQWTGEVSSPSTNQFLQWNDPASTPVEDIRKVRTLVHLASGGFAPNKLVIGRSVYDALRNHPDILDLIKYQGTPANPAQVTLNALAALFDLDEVLVTEAVNNTAAEGQTASFSYISDKSALLVYTPDAPGLGVPASGYTFNWTGLFGTGNAGTRVKAFRMEWLDSLRVEVDQAYDMQIMDNTLGGYFITAVA